MSRAACSPTTRSSPTRSATLPTMPGTASGRCRCGRTTRSSCAPISPTWRTSAAVPRAALPRRAFLRGSRASSAGRTSISPGRRGSAGARRARPGGRFPCWCDSCCGTPDESDQHRFLFQRGGPPPGRLPARRQSAGARPAHADLRARARDRAAHRQDAVDLAGDRLRTALRGARRARRGNPAAHRLRRRSAAGLRAASQSRGGMPASLRALRAPARDRRHRRRRAQGRAQPLPLLPRSRHRGKAGEEPEPGARTGDGRRTRRDHGHGEADGARGDRGVGGARALAHRAQVVLDKSFDPAAIEQPWYQRWESSSYFSASADDPRPPYCIQLPPPNVTGTLHMGHAFQQTLMDALIRYHRMRGFNANWVVGTDHAGIATQIVVERQLEEEGKTRHDLGREKFIERVWQWKQKSGATITRQMRRLGASANWAYADTEGQRAGYFTMDARMSRAVV